MSRPNEPSSPPQPSAWGGNVPNADNKRNLAPNRKVLAGLGGTGIGGALSTIIAYHLPQMPGTVVAAYTLLIIAVFSFGFAYLVPPGENE